MLKTSEKPWEPKEEELLRQILEEINYETERPRWHKVAKLYNSRSPLNDFVYRNSRELKKKWISSICQIQRGLWRKDEDLFLLESVRDFGKKWSFISRLMKELRTQNGVKNRFMSLMDKEFKINKKKKGHSLSEEEMVKGLIKKIKGLQGAEQQELSDEDSKGSIVPVIKTNQLSEDQNKKSAPSTSTNLSQEQAPNLCFMNPGFMSPFNFVYSPVVENLMMTPFLTPVILNWNYLPSPLIPQMVPGMTTPAGSSMGSNTFF